MIKKGQLVVLIVCILSILNCNAAFAKKLTRKEAKKIYINSGLFAVCCSINPRLWKVDIVKDMFEKSGFGTFDSSWLGSLRPTKKYMAYNIRPYRYDFQKDEPFKQIIKESIFLFAIINDVEITGISPLSESSAMVECRCQLKLTDFGEIFGKIKNINLVLKYQYYDDGWRFKKILWDEVEQQNNHLPVMINALYNPYVAVSIILENMHKYKIYSDNYLDLVNFLERSKYYKFKKTIAWSYFDNGDQLKGIKIYRDEVLPEVKEQGNPAEISNYEKDFKLMASNTRKNIEARKKEHEMIEREKQRLKILLNKSKIVEQSKITKFSYEFKDSEQHIYEYEISNTYIKITKYDILNYTNVKYQRFGLTIPFTDISEVRYCLKQHSSYSRTPRANQPRRYFLSL